ncbi:hypothetical protein [Microbacterium sp. P05]|uniref:hypothetical protein n=1 Tax=Microbacterium sp. P05 TaxID=3366948 RepID=UPI003745672D
MSDVTEPAHNLGENLVETMFATWVDDDLEQRGDRLVREDVFRAVIELPPFGAPPIVRINDEVSLQARAIASTPIKKGESVTAENISGLESFWPVDVHANSGWFAYLVIGTKAYIAFDFRYNKQRNAELLGLADDYLDTVEATYERALRPAVDNLLSAAELSVQAQMLSQSQETKFHNVRDKWLRDNERLGNAPEGFYATLLRLREERAAARYGDGSLSITPGEMPDLIAIVRTMVDHAVGRVGVVAVSDAISVVESETAIGD